MRSPVQSRVPEAQRKPLSTKMLSGFYFSPRPSCTSPPLPHTRLPSRSFFVPPQLNSMDGKAGEEFRYFLFLTFYFF